MNVLFSLTLAALIPQDGKLKPYADVIPSSAITQEGLFKVHRLGEKIYFEIPKAIVGKDMLWQAQEVAIPAPLGSPGPQANRLVRWTRHGAKIYLEGIDASIRSNGDPNLEIGARSLTPPAILAAFKIEAEGPGEAAVIDVGDFLISDPKDMNIAQSWSASLDSNRSYVEKVKAFPGNIEMESLLTFTLKPVDTIPGTEASYSPQVGPNASVRMHYSFVKLPDKPMMPRYRDPRVGYFGYMVKEVGGPEHRAVTREVISRFRLEKKDPTAPLSEPVRPIVFYLAPEMPVKWRPYAKRAVEAWRPAFEQAGFKNAIECRDAPTKAQDPDWDIEDARYSVIRWIPADTENAYGIKIGDPRTGETLSGQVVFYHNFLSFLQNTYFAQVAALDPQAHRLPFNDNLMGHLLEYILTHEVGHTIGLEHNMKASSTYTIANLRDAAFVRKHDIASSIMDYARFNYVSQPEDRVPLDRAIGQYDKFAVEWGYKVFPGCDTPLAEKPLLDGIASRQNANPFLRFGNYVHPEDPAVIGEDLGDDPIEAAKLGRRNLRRAAKLLVPAAVRPGQDFVQLKSTYAFLVRQHEQLLDNVIRLVGGVNANDHRMSNGNSIYTIVSAGKQRSAVQFLVGSDSAPPTELLSPEIADRLYASGDLKRVMNFQNIVIFSLFSETRIVRMFDQEARLGPRAYSVRQMLEDLERGIWRELDESRPTVSIFRRPLQRGYLATLDGKLNGPAATRTDLLSIGRASLRALARRLDRAVPRADRDTAVHWAECRRQIEAIILGTSPAGKVPAPPVTPTARFTGSADPCFRISNLQWPGPFDPQR